MRNLKDMIQELVHLHGQMEFNDLTSNQRKTMLSHAVRDPQFDDYDTYIDGIHIPQLTQAFLEGIYDENSIGCELMDRLEDYFEPLLNKLFEDEYIEQYADRSDMYYKNAV